MPSVDAALIHEARVWRTVRAGVKNAQGERVPVAEPGPWFPARRTTRGQPGDKSAADPGGRKRSERRWLLIWGDEDASGALIDAPRESDEVEVKLDDERPTVRYEIAGRPEPYDDGDEVFGGQAVLIEVGDSA